MKGCQHCGAEIPFHRHGNSPYCSEECAREVRNRTSAKFYEQSKYFRKLFVGQALLLQKFYAIQELGHPVVYEHLKKEGFNFGFSLSETLAPSGEFARVVGPYCYFFNPNTKIVKIWKLNSKKFPTL